jgi:hypothetical protein
MHISLFKSSSSSTTTIFTSTAAANITHPPPYCLSMACRKACSAGGPSPDATHHLDVADLLRQYGKEPGVLDNKALEQACTAIMACQVWGLHWACILLLWVWQLFESGTCAAQLVVCLCKPISSSFVTVSVSYWHQPSGNLLCSHLECV